MIWFKYDGVGYEKWEVRLMTEYLRTEGFWNVHGWPTCDVVYWVKKHCPISPKALISIGRVDV